MLINVSAICGSLIRLVTITGKSTNFFTCADISIFNACSVNIGAITALFPGEA